MSAVLLDEVEQAEAESMERAADLIAESIADGEFSTTCGRPFTCSARSCFTGPEACSVNAIVEPALMVTNGAGRALIWSFPSC